METPWSVAKIAFDLGICPNDEDERIFKYLTAQPSLISLPKGWELIETTISGCAGFVAIFNVEGQITKKDGITVAAILDSFHSN